MDIDENRFFREATLRICGNLDFEFALQECLIYLKSFMPASGIGATFYDRGLNAVRTIAIATATEAQKVNKIWPLNKEGARYFDNPDLPKVKIINRPLTDPNYCIDNKKNRKRKEQPNFGPVLGH